MSPRRLLVIEHEADAPVALFGEWLTGVGVELEVIRPWKGDPVPSQVATGGLVVLGGAMAAEDDDVAPWLPAVRSLLREAVPAGVPTLGICLGAQLMAVATGGRVERGDAGPELGVCRLELSGAAAADPLFGPLRPPLAAAQWHMDAITALPGGAVVLASSDRYDVQAFRVGEAAWGVQFHPEVDRAVMASWAAGDPADTFTPQQLEQAVAEVGEAEPVLRATWRLVAERFAGILDERP
jgi:GMP synthase-like glutamine amidotransferase